MKVHPKDGVCRSCRGQLVIVDADDATMTAECTECGEFMVVETDAFGDGCMTYWPAVMAAKMREDA